MIILKELIYGDGDGDDCDDTDSDGDNEGDEMMTLMVMMVNSKEDRWSCWASATARIPNIPVLANIFRSRW